MVIDNWNENTLPHTYVDIDISLLQNQFCQDQDLHLRFKEKFNEVDFGRKCMVTQLKCEFDSSC